jgi:hypothetical protein
VDLQGSGRVVIDRIKRIDADPAKFVPAPQVAARPGMPIGEDEDF